MALNDQLNAERSRLLEQSAKARRNAYAVELTAKVLGRRFLTLDPGIEEIRYLDQLADGWQVAVRSDLSWDARDAGLDCTTFLIEALDFPIMHGTSFVAEIRKHQHIRIVYDGIDVGYAISRDALLSLSDEELVGAIAKAMARVLAREIKAARR